MGSLPPTTPLEVVHPRSPAAVGRRLVGYGISLLAALGIVVAVGDVFGPQYPGLMRLGVALCLGAQALVIVACLRPSRLLWPITIASGLGIVAITVGLLLVPAPWDGLEWRTNIWLGPVLQFLILLHPKRRAWPLLAIVSLACWSLVTVVHHLDWRIQVLDLVFTLTPIATLGIGGACITNLLFELRLSQLRRIQDEQDTRRTEMREHERRARVRLVHDSLLHTLQQIARGWAQPTPAEASALAVSVAAELQESSDSFDDGSSVELRPALEAALMNQGCDITWRGTAGVVPSPVLEAMVGAAREAVRNVAKHSTGAAVVSVTRVAGGCRVTVVDEGSGFDVATRPAGRLGMEEGIIRRMSDVGGHASITTGALGTTVKLEWIDEPFGHAEPFGPVARTLISWLPVPVLAASLVHVLVLEVGPSAIGVALIWVTAALVSILGMRRLRVSGLAWWQPLVLTALALAAIVANYAWLPPEGTNGYDVWTPSLVGALMVLALPGRRLVAAIIMAAGVILVTVVSCAFYQGWDAVLGSQLGSIMAVLMYVLAPLALATGASILANHARRTDELRAAKRLSAELAAERDATRREWIVRMRRLADPFLMGIAEGKLDPSDTSVVRRAKILESRLRDELSLWPHGTGIADRAHRLRLDGWDCTLDLAVANDAEKQSLLHLMAQLPHPVRGQRLHITHRLGQAVATITDPPFTDRQWRDVGPGMEQVRDEDFTQLRNSSTTRDQYLSHLEAS
ncbi:MAG: hypothetical protein Q4P15_08210 [Propionibacteriaceae bacterium]|nr:hypothetical protein [Propionibacteriaceae bacterium]